MENIVEHDNRKENEDFDSNILYVADLPIETTNEDLSKLFKDYHFQFATLNNIKNNIIWAKAHFENKEWATKARHEFNGYILKPINSTNITQSRPIRICKYEGKGTQKSKNMKQNLLVKNLDINMTQKELYKIFLEYGDISSGKIEYDENGISKGFGYIYYFTEESAEEAKKNLNGKTFFGKPMEVVNLIPGKKNKSNNITLFVLNLPNNISKEKLSSIFEQFGPISNISIYPKGIAYVSYNNFDSASKCLNQMKINPISFPGLNPVVVKHAISKEERESNKNFMLNNFDRNNNNENNYCIQFNYLFFNPEIKNDMDLDKEIRLFIKVILLMDYTPKEVLVDLESMSGLVIFEKYKDYILFFEKYKDFCTKQPPIFDCLPYEMPPKYNERPNYYNNQIQYPWNNNQISFNQEFNFMMTNKAKKRNNNFPNMNIGMIGNNNLSYNQNNYNNMNNNFGNNNMNNSRKRYQGNNNYKNNNGGQNMNNNRNKLNNGNKNNNNHKNIIQRPNMGNTNRKFIFRQNYGNSYNININMNQNMLPMNPFMNPQMMMNPKKNILKYNNRNNNGRKQYNQINYQNQNYEEKNNDLGDNSDFLNNFRNDLTDKRKNDIDLIDQRNLQNLNPSQLHSQFNKPPINLYGPNMLNSKEQEDLVNEIADSIYEIVYSKYPNEASKITGMIKEKGYEKMNMLLSKQEDLNEIIDKAYKMIKNSKNNNNSKTEIIDNKQQS